MIEESERDPELENVEGGPQSSDKIAQRIAGLGAKVDAKAGKEVALKEVLSDVREREAMKKNLDEATETRKFWAKFFGDGVIATVLTKISLMGTGISAEDLSTGSFWGDVEKFEDELKEKGVDVDSRVAAHRLNSIEKLKDALARDEDKVEIDVRVKSGELYLSHDPDQDLTPDRSFDGAMRLLAGHPNVKIMMDVKELSAAKMICAQAPKYPALQRTMFMSHNPKVLDYINKSKQLPQAPLVFHYFPLDNAPMPVSATAKLLGGTGVKRIADMVTGLYPGDLYKADATTFAINDTWEELQAHTQDEEIYCAWDKFPPDNMIEELRSGGREVWISIPHSLMPSGIGEWIDAKNSNRGALGEIKLLSTSVGDMADTGEALQHKDVDAVISDAASEVDERLGGLQDAA